MKKKLLSGCGLSDCRCEAVNINETVPVVEDHNVSGIIRKRFSSIGSFFLSILIAFFPKCAFCWAAYFTLLNSFGVRTIPYLPWLKSVFSGLLVVSLILLYFTAKRKQRWLIFSVQLSGIVCLLISQYPYSSDVGTWVGISIMFLGSILHISRSWSGKNISSINASKKGIETITSAISK